jgi:hypothetical protein
MVGLESRSTIKVDDDVTFSVNRVADIREADEYPGIRVSLIASYPPLRVPLSVDVTTGDKITPHEIEYSIPLLFDDRTISMMAYNLETILAEKVVIKPDSIGVVMKYQRVANGCPLWS